MQQRNLNLFSHCKPNWPFVLQLYRHIRFWKINHSVGSFPARHKPSLLIIKMSALSFKYFDEFLTLAVPAQIFGSTLSIIVLTFKKTHPRTQEVSLMKEVLAVLINLDDCARFLNTKVVTISCLQLLTYHFSWSPTSFRASHDQGAFIP